MFANLKPTTAFAATLLSITLGFGSTASANHYDHIDRVAVRVQKNAQRLLDETKNYRRAPGFHQLVNQTRLVRDTAIHIHDVTHFEGNIPHLKRDVAMIDRSFHQLEELFCYIEAEVERGRCHLDVNTNRFRRKMIQLEREIHHLGDDLAKICEVPHVVARASYAEPIPQYAGDYRSYHNSDHSNFYSGRHQGFHGGNKYNRYQNPNNRTARGISIGGGSTRLWIGF